MNIREIFLYIPIVLINLYGLYLSQTDRERYTVLFDHEDHFAEWCSILLLLLLVLVCIYRAVRNIHYNRGHMIANAFYAAAFLFMSGEEISWGQRIFNLEPGEWIIKHSYQNEINIHNLLVFDMRLTNILDVVWVIVMLVYLFIIAPLYWKKSGITAYIDKIALPVPRLRQIAFLIVIVICVDVYLYFDGLRSGEHLEMNLFYFYLMVFLFPCNSYRYNRQSTA